MSTKSLMFRRLRALCVRYWKIAPWEFDAAMQRGDVTMADVIDLFTMLCHNPIDRLWVFEYVYPEARHIANAKEKKAKWKRQMEQIGTMAAQPSAKRKPKPNNAPVVGMEHAVRNTRP